MEKNTTLKMLHRKGSDDGMLANALRGGSMLAVDGKDTTFDDVVS